MGLGEESDKLSCTKPRTFQRLEASFTTDKELLKEMWKLKAGDVGITELPDNVAGADGED